MIIQAIVASAAVSSVATIVLAHKIYKYQNDKSTKYKNRRLRLHTRYRQYIDRETYPSKYWVCPACSCALFIQEKNLKFDFTFCNGIDDDCFIEEPKIHSHIKCNCGWKGLGAPVHDDE